MFLICSACRSESHASEFATKLGEVACPLLASFGYSTDQCTACLRATGYAEELACWEEDRYVGSYALCLAEWDILCCDDIHDLMNAEPTELPAVCAAVYADQCRAVRE